jgi:hypothetical protein
VNNIDALSDPGGDRVAAFCHALVAAGEKPGSGAIPWKRFMSRSRVERALAACGLELIEECADHDPTLKRFFAMIPVTGQCEVDGVRV